MYLVLGGHRLAVESVNDFVVSNKQTQVQYWQATTLIQRWDIYFHLYISIQCVSDISQLSESVLVFWCSLVSVHKHHDIFLGVKLPAVVDYSHANYNVINISEVQINFNA